VDAFFSVSRSAVVHSKPSLVARTDRNFKLLLLSLRLLLGGRGLPRAQKLALQ
jgi:hypothetical protein